MFAKRQDNLIKLHLFMISFLRIELAFVRVFKEQNSLPNVILCVTSSAL